jgi:hypothetical protein
MGPKWCRTDSQAIFAGSFRRVLSIAMGRMSDPAAAAFLLQSNEIFLLEIM